MNLPSFENKTYCLFEPPLGSLWLTYELNLLPPFRFDSFLFVTYRIVSHCIVLFSL